MRLRPSHRFRNLRSFARHGLRSLLRHELTPPLLVGLLLRLLAALLVPSEPSWDGVVYVRAGEQLARGEGYTLRILNEAGSSAATAYYPVGFPAWLALVRMLGGGFQSDRVLQALLGACQVPFAYAFARRASSRAAGRYAAYCAALWPGAILLSASWLSEPLFAFGLGLALLPLVYVRRRQWLRALLLSGLGLGVLGYVRASALPIAACLGLGLGYGHARTQPWARRAACALGAALLVLGFALLPLAPWALRNHARLGSPVLVSTNGGANLLQGTRGQGGYTRLPDDSPCYRQGLGEVARDRCFSQAAVAQIQREPLAWIGRGLLKLTHTFGHESAPAQVLQDGLRLPRAQATTLGAWALGVCRLGFLLVLSAALAGSLRLWVMGPSRMRVLLFAPLVGLSALHFVYLGGDRYHAALMPIWAALAGVGIAALLDPRLRTTHFTESKSTSDDIQT